MHATTAVPDALAPKFTHTPLPQSAAELQLAEQYPMGHSAPTTQLPAATVYAAHCVARVHAEPAGAPGAPDELLELPLPPLQSHAARSTPLVQMSCSNSNVVRSHPAVPPELEPEGTHWQVA